MPDNLKAAVIQFKKDDVPVLNESFRDLTEHYQVGVLPARPRKPRDKGKAESGVLVAQRKILAVLRNVTFFGIQELNAAIFEEVVQRQNFLQLTTKLFTVAGFLEFHGEKLFSLRRSSELRSLNEA